MSKKNGKEQLSLDRIQTYGKYLTDSAVILDGTEASSASAALDSGLLYRVKAFDADCWVKIGSAPVAVAGEGMLMTQYDEITLVVDDGDQIAVIGGQLNITPLI